MEQHIWDLLKHVIDPEVEINIVDLGLVYKVEIIEQNNVDVEMTLSTPACPIGDVIVSNVVETIQREYPNIEVDVNLVFDPLWNAEMISDEGKKMLAGR